MAQVPTRVRIVGGGLAGILAAFQAHRLGCRQIELYERYDTLGGSRRPRLQGRYEIREAFEDFGPAGDPARRLLADHGLAFDDFENRCGSVSPTPCGDLAFTHDFDGPALRARTLAAKAPLGDSLADRLRAYPGDLAHALQRYCEWRLGTWLDVPHAAAAAALGIDQVFPVGVDLAALAAARKACPRHAALYGIPRALCGRLDDTTAAQPRGGFSALFYSAHRELARLGVAVRTETLVSPRHALAERAPGDVLLWAADPAPLYPLVGLQAPNPLARPVATYVYKARYAGPVPFRLNNFTAEGSVFRIHLYETRDQGLLAAECVAETAEGELRREIHRLMAGFGGASLTLAEPIATEIRSRAYPSVEGTKASRALRTALARQQGVGFIAGGWEAQTKAAMLDEITAGLTAAFTAEAAAAA